VTISGPPPPPRPGDSVNHDELEALIVEAHRRVPLRRMGIAACVLAALAGTAIFLGGT
jgi:hypothetical protein